MALKADLLAVVSKLNGDQGIELKGKDLKKVLDNVLDSIIRLTVESGKLQLVGFGTFEVRERAARKGRNPQTGEEIQIAASKVPAFKAGKALKDSVKA